MGILKRFFFILVLCLSTQVHAEQTEADYVHSIDFIEKLNRKYPELLWLTGHSISNTQENKSLSSSQSWSEKIFDKHYPEYDRSILSIISLHLIRIGDYNAYKYFIKSQPLGKKLRFQNFQKLNMKVQELQKWDPKIIEALETALVLRDVGKTSIAHKKIKDVNLTEPDHDLFYAKVIKKYAHIFPSFNALSLRHQALLKKEANIIHYGHFSHLEGGPEMLTKIEKSNLISKQPWIFDFNLLIHLCDVAGASGHLYPLGAREMNEETFQIKHLMRKSVLQLKYKSRQDVLKYFIDERAKWIDQPLTSSSDYIIVRTAAMLRITTPEYTTKFNKAFAQLSQEQKNLILEEFYPLTERDSATPTYVPAVLLNIFHNHSLSSREKQRIKFLFHHGLPFIATVLHEFRHNHANIPYNKNLTLNFNEIARIAREDPLQLKTRDYQIEEDGTVIIPHQKI